MALWFGSFASACMAATGPACETPGGNCAKGEVAFVVMACDQLIASCELPALDTPIVSSFDFSFAPVALTTVPTQVFATNVPRAPPLNWQATRPPATPLYIKHLALLN